MPPLIMIMVFTQKIGTKAGIFFFGSKWDQTEFLGMKNIKDLRKRR